MWSLHATMFSQTIIGSSNTYERQVVQASREVPCAGVSRSLRWVKRGRCGIALSAPMVQRYNGAMLLWCYIPLYQSM